MVTIPIVTPIRALPIIISIKKISSSFRLENPINSQDTAAITLISKRVFRLPILSERYPDNKLPMGLEIAVIDANHEICDEFKRTSASAFDNSCVVIAG